MSATLMQVLERLALVYAEVPGAVTATVLPSAIHNEREGVPYAYSIVGPSSPAIPSSTHSDNLQTRTIIARVLVATLSTSDEEAGTMGDQAMRACITMIDSFTAHLLRRPFLKTATLGDLNVVEAVQVTDSGPRQIVGPGGVAYAGVDFTLTLTLRFGTGR